MDEEILVFFWRNHLIPRRFETTQNQAVEILDYGIPSIDSGPDFVNVKIRIDGQIWVGAVEMHIKSKDWYVHNHNQDPAFRNVILHVVSEDDKPVVNQHGELIPTLVYQPPTKFLELYRNLIYSKGKVKCDKYLKLIPSYITAGWLDNLLIERLEQRAKQIINDYKNAQSDWEQVFFQQLSRALGMRVNSLPMESLARLIPYRVLRRYTDQIQVLEAILFGKAGFLQQAFSEQYPQKLKQLFAVYRRKYDLEPMEVSIWKFMRLRPYNFPTIRIAQLAAILSKTDHLFSLILESELKELIQIFSASASQYWDTHFRFDIPAQNMPKVIGKSMRQGLIINAVAPVLFAYGRMVSEQKYVDKAIQFLQSVKFESNYVTRLFKKLQIKQSNAADSQALVQLYTHYCQRQRCLDCRLASYILTDELSKAN